VAAVCEDASANANWMRLFVVSCLLSASALSTACGSQERLTSKATPCATKEVKIVGSEFARQGVTTAWCAECKGKLYQCATNVDRTKVECRPSPAEAVCR
jgi:hypothetical protein